MTRHPDPVIWQQLSLNKGALQSEHHRHHVTLGMATPRRPERIRRDTKTALGASARQKLIAQSLQVHPTLKTTTCRGK
jgi:hypothetical protein